MARLRRFLDDVEALIFKIGVAKFLWGITIVMILGFLLGTFFGLQNLKT